MLMVDTRDLPVPAQEASAHARVSDLAKSSGRSRLTRPSVLPSVFCKTSALGSLPFRGSMAGLCSPLSTLRRCPHGHLRMTRGRCGSLLLHRRGLAPPTSCRSPGAHKTGQIRRLQNTRPLRRHGRSDLHGCRVQRGQGHAMAVDPVSARDGARLRGSPRRSARNLEARCSADVLTKPEFVPVRFCRCPMCPLGKKATPEWTRKRTEPHCHLRYPPPARSVSNPGAGPSPRRTSHLSIRVACASGLVCVRILPPGLPRWGHWHVRRVRFH